jgi:hypothetical protein
MSEQFILSPPPDSDPEYTALLEADAEARMDLQAAQAKGNPSAISDAGWKVTEAYGTILAYEQRQAGNWIRGLRFVIRHFRELLRMMLVELLGLDVLREDIRALRSDTDDIADAVVNLEAKHEGVGR